jgi:transposase InsO family protein
MLEGMKRMAVQISARTGLKEATCLDLLLSGWAFRRHENGDPDQWISSNGSVSLPKVA